MTHEDYLDEHWYKPLQEADVARLRIMAEAKLAWAEAAVKGEREWIRVAGEHFGWTPSKS